MKRYTQRPFRNMTTYYIHLTKFASASEKGRNLTQSNDKSPYTDRKIQKSNMKTQKCHQNFDYTTIADRLWTVSWGSDSHPTGVVKPVYLPPNRKSRAIKRTGQSLKSPASRGTLPSVLALTFKYKSCSAGTSSIC